MLHSPRSPPRPRTLLAAALLLLGAIPGVGRPADLLARGAPEATVVLVARSIGSKRGDPLDLRGHAALLVRIAAQAGGFIVQGGKEPGPRSLFAQRHRVVGWAIPSADPSADFAKAVGGYWGEAEAREMPTRELGRFAVPGLTEARVRELVEALNEEFRDRAYRLEGGPSSNSFVSRCLDRLGLPLPALGGERLPGWGWRP